MKKCLAFFICLSLCIGFLYVAEADNIKESDLLGSWDLVEFIDPKNPGINLANMIDSHVAFLKNGNVLMALSDDNKGAGNWILNNDSIEIQNASFEVSFDTGKKLLTIAKDDYVLSYSRVTNGALLKEIETSNIKDFEGEWVLDSIVMYDTRVNVNVLKAFGTDIGVNLNVRDGKAVLELINKGTSSQRQYDVSLKNNSLYFPNNQVEGISSFVLTENNMLKCSVGDIICYLKNLKSPIDSWICPNCGNQASGKFCNNCGAAYNSVNVDKGTGNVTALVSLELKDGIYKIGEDIPAGTYVITCLEVEDYLSDYMGALGGLGGEEYGNFMNALGGLASSLESCSIWVADAYGNIIKSSELQKGDKVTLVLKNGNAIEVSGGKCRFDQQ